MSILSTVETDVEKGVAFVEKVFSKVDEIDQIFIKLAPATKAAVLATFYDSAKTAVSVEGVVADATSGNFSGAVTLSATTVQLVKTVITDVKNDVAVAKADLTALGIL